MHTLAQAIVNNRARQVTKLRLAAIKSRAIADRYLREAAKIDANPSVWLNPDDEAQWQRVCAEPAARHAREMDARADALLAAGADPTPVAVAL